MGEGPLSEVALLQLAAAGSFFKQFFLQGYPCTHRAGYDVAGVIANGGSPLRGQQPGGRAGEGAAPAKDRGV